MSKKNILIVDDEKNLRESIAELMTGEGFQADQSEDGADALPKIRSGSYDCVLLDIRMPRMDGLQVLQRLHEDSADHPPVIVISAFGDGEQTIQAIRLGAFDYITKPLDIDELLGTVGRAMSQAVQAKAERSAGGRSLKGTLRVTASDEPEMIGNSRAMREIFKQIGRVAATDATVLINGESGTGKELVARAIHDHSIRRSGPFVAVNCGAIPDTLIESELFGHEKGAFTGAATSRKGRFEMAQGGSIFLDEVGELPLHAQVKLLRVLQERKVDRLGGAVSIPVSVRVIAATNRNLRDEVRKKLFREDLYYRLDVVSLYIPPLRERLADVPQLAEYFLERVNRKNHLSPKLLSDAAIRVLLDRDYSGNVRELENIIERAAVSSGSSTILLPEHFERAETANSVSESHDSQEMNLKLAVANLERKLIVRALQVSSGNRSEAARILGINRRLLYSKMDEHNIGQ